MQNECENIRRWFSVDRNSLDWNFESARIPNYECALGLAALNRQVCSRQFAAFQLPFFHYKYLLFQFFDVHRCGDACWQVWRHVAPRATSELTSQQRLKHLPTRPETSRSTEARRALFTQVRIFLVLSGALLYEYDVFRRIRAEAMEINFW